MAHGADYFFLFNSDAVATPGCLEQLVAAAEAVPRVAFVGPLLVGAQNADTVQAPGSRLGSGLPVITRSRAGVRLDPWALRRVAWTR